MTPVIDTSKQGRILWTIVAATLSGGLSAAALTPVMDKLQGLGLDDLLGLLVSFASTAGIAFGLVGGALLHVFAKQRAVVSLLFLVTSMAGIAGAVYVAIIFFDHADPSFILPYGLASPVGTLSVAVPLAFVARYRAPWTCIGLATLLPTGWAIGVAAFFDHDVALEFAGLSALYIGWQALLLAVFVLSPKAARAEPTSQGSALGS
ncbi:hypothetical protein [Gymnodinialimonas sp. 57CJ19]|uniref:hypothetical protein n=1 Tax=Gymnodinialimonas sp. 57CJ19 TaxID=3138498 RepID=UPI0031342ADC